MRPTEPAPRPDVETRTYTASDGATRYTITVEPGAHPATLAAELRKLPVGAELADAHAHHDGGNLMSPAWLDGVELIYRVPAPDASG